MRAKCPVLWRRSAFRGCGLAAVAALAIGVAVGGCAAARAQDKVEEGLQTGAMGPLRMSLPEIAGKYHLQYEFRNFSDSTAAMQAVEHGDIDIANTTVQHMVRAIDDGIPVVWVGGWGGGYNVLIEAKSLGVPANDWKALANLAKHRAAEQRPLKIGVPTGSMQHLKLVVALRDAGIDPDKEVDIVNIPFPTHPRAIDGGDVDMAMTLATFGAMSINDGKGALFAHIFGGAAGKQEIGFIVSRDALMKRPDFIARIVASHAEAMKGFVSDPKKETELDLRYLKLPDPVVTMVDDDFLRLSDHTNMADLALMAHQMYAVGWAKKDYSAEMDKLVDFDLLEKATGETKAELDHW